ncbi:MAG: hypothetical protein KF726_12295 [Anaerolineae bacterium]|nr:hypothetical protein [Anaerolineae bacterium]
MAEQVLERPYSSRNDIFLSIRNYLREESLHIPIIIFLVFRLLTGAAALYMVHHPTIATPSWVHERNPSGQTFDALIPPTSQLGWLVEPWKRWDTAWYGKIAMTGYRADTAIVFPPLYPVLMRLAAPFLSNDYVLAGVVISNICCMIAFILLFKLIRLEFQADGKNSGLATRTLLLMAAFPTGYYLFAAYTESVFLVFVLGAWLSALNRRWWLAGILAALAALTRLQGAVLCLPLFWIAYVQQRDLAPRNREALLRGWLARIPAVIGAPVAMLGYLGYLAINNFGTLEAAYAKEWQLYTRLPFEAFQAFIDRAIHGKTLPFENDNALALLFLLITGLIVLWRLRPAYSLYVGASLGMILLRYHTGPQFESMIRYALMFFPCFIVLAMALRKWWLLAPYLLWGLNWQSILLDRFIHWTWVA